MSFRWLPALLWLSAGLLLLTALVDFSPCVARGDGRSGGRLCPARALLHAAALRPIQRPARAAHSNSQSS
jgi:hypothetical protein